MPLWQPSKALSRPSYYDRDPYPVYIYQQANVAPHGSTVRGTYSPPLGYAAFIETVYALALRAGAAGVVGFVDVAFQLLPFYGGAATLLYLLYNNNTAYYQERASLTSYGYVAYGDTVQFRTSDSGTGGSNIFVVSMKGTEFLY